MKKAVSGILFFTLACRFLSADIPEDPGVQRLLQDSLVVNMRTRIFNEAKDILWESELSKLTIPGRAVTVTMKNNQARLSVHFTPYRQEGNHIILVAQSEIWLVEMNQAMGINGKGAGGAGAVGKPSGFRYFTSMKSIPLSCGELVYFYPLGRLDNKENPEDIHIEMGLRILHYEEGNERDGQTGKGEPGNP